MTYINQTFSDPELESIINNASEKIVTANDDEDDDSGDELAWFIVDLTIYTVATLAELVRCIQTRNILHLVLSVPAILMIVDRTLTWTKVIDTSLPEPVAKWIMLMVPAYLLCIWLHSMNSHIEDPHRQRYFRFILIWSVLFSIAELLECIFFILWITPVQYEIVYYYYTIWDAVSAIEITSSVLFSLLCAWILFRFQNILDSEAPLKRRQLFTILLIYLSLVAFFLALPSVDDFSLYAAVPALIAYFVLTSISYDAMVAQQHKSASCETDTQNNRQF
jgi:multisubunit Na+/H+ antiporter MnhG subunit